MKLLRIFFLITSCIFLSSCASEAEEIKNPTQKEAELAVQKMLPPKAELIIPENPSYDRPIIQVDLDHDNISEAIAFYREKSNPGQIGILIAKKNQKQKWEKTTLQVKGNYLHYAGFEDADGDKKREAFIGTADDKDSQQKKLVVLPLDPKGKPLMEKQYTHMVAKPLEYRNRADLVLVQLQYDDLTAIDSTVYLYQWEKDKYKVTDQHKVESMQEIHCVRAGKIDAKRKALIYTYAVGSHGEMGVYQIKDGKMIDFSEKHPEIEERVGFQPLLHRPDDVNGDGILEFPFSYFTSEFGLPYENQTWITDWYQITPDNRTKLVLQSHTNYEVGLRFDFPEKWKGEFSLVPVPFGESDPVTYEGFNVIYQKRGAQPNDEKLNGPTILSIYYIDPEEWPKYKKKSKRDGMPYTVLDRANGYVFVAEFSPKDYLRGYPEVKPFMLLSEKEVRSLYKRIPTRDQMG